MELELTAKLNLSVGDDKLSKMAVISKEPYCFKWKNKHKDMKFPYPSQRASIHSIEFWNICCETLHITLCQCT